MHLFAMVWAISARSNDPDSLDYERLVRGRLFRDATGPLIRWSLAFLKSRQERPTKAKEEVS